MKNNFVDIVYLYVDGEDEAYLQQKEEMLKKLHPDSQAINKCRFIDNDELMYSLRSLEKFANWINNIYIITNNKPPKWLNIDNPRIKVINQADIMPINSQPCFNSMSIEHCVVNIPNLSEYFLLACDDYFFLDNVDFNFFFKKNKPIYRFNKRKYQRDKKLYNHFLSNASDLVYYHFGYRCNLYPHHNIEPYKKSIIRECYKIFKQEIDNTIYSPFRKKENIEKSIYANYAIATKKAYFKKIARIDSYLPLYKKILFHFLKIYSKDSIDISTSRKDIIWEVLNFKPKLFCINDDEATTNEDRSRMKKLLENFFPDKSEFER